MTQKRNVTIRAACDICGDREVAEGATFEDAQQKLVDRGWHIFGFAPASEYCITCANDVNVAIQELMNHA